MFTGKIKKSTLMRVSKKAKEKIENLAEKEKKTQVQVLDDILKDIVWK